MPRSTGWETFITAAPPHDGCHVMELGFSDNSLLTQLRHTEMNGTAEGWWWVVSGVGVGGNTTSHWYYTTTNTANQLSSNIWRSTPQTNILFIASRLIPPPPLRILIQLSRLDLNSNSVARRLGFATDRASFCVMFAAFPMPIIIRVHLLYYITLAFVETYSSLMIATDTL
jgi:hypothetical protein